MPDKRPNQEYIPGVCNIGPAERRRRLQGAFAGVVSTLIVLGLLYAIDAPMWWRLILVLPASAAATGFLQYGLHFCVGFGMKGIFNVINSVGIVNNVDMEAYRLKDKQKAQSIIVWSGLIGLAVAGLSLLLP